MASPVYGKTTEMMINDLLCVLPPQISALMRHSAKAVFVVLKMCKYIYQLSTNEVCL